jgi:ATP-dependent DNA helicase RecG
LGASQSGRRSSLRLVRVARDGQLIDRAREYAEAILTSDPDLSGHPELLATIQARLDESSEDYLEKN